jgi:hypothetical protein
MTKLLEQAIAKIQTLPADEQDAFAAVLLSMAEGDAADFPIDDSTRAAIHEGLAQADRGEFVPDDIVAAADKRHGL